MNESGDSTLVALADRVAEHRWVEQRLFELTGRWSAHGEDPTVVRFFARGSAVHVWRAHGWEDRATRSVTVAPRPPSTGWIELVSGADEVSMDLGRLALWANVAIVDELVRCRRDLALSRDAADDGLRRWLGIVENDLVRGWVQAQVILGDRFEPSTVVAVNEAESTARNQLFG